MLEKALLFISNLLNKELKMSFGLTDDMVVVGSLINLDGSITKNIENKVVLSIINLEHEKTIKHREEYINNGQGSFNKINEPVYLNLYLLISANYNSDNYMEALKMLSAVIGVFQASRVFKSETYPDLDPLIKRLAFEIYNVPVQELSHVWSGIGAKYVPSMLYKVRMIGIQKGQIKEQIASISGLETSAKKQ
ncbi:DUF4255 domain-containing protein [Flavivirga amylovorans]|uniref:DUF4255 domain-containing protein n=1 Tax=Flavivirga amylovorans TaxID=870486 RepID=A0ABT8X4Q4_9FLAO|nr:DUF4255 domain-containing protein [Flavivirga amylovorans]MDO5988889.1 DUF4255 domain-containing protein [Flavivirga amylovorans]